MVSFERQLNWLLFQLELPLNAGGFGKWQYTNYNKAPFINIDFNDIKPLYGCIVS